MLPAFAKLEDLSARLGRVFGDNTVEERRARAALDDVSSAIRDCAGKSWVNDDGELDLPSEASSTVPDTLRSVCVAAARRVYENPENYTQASIGATSYTYGNSSSDVYLTRSEQRRVRRAAGRSGLQAMPTTRSTVGSTGVAGGLETARCRDGATVNRVPRRRPGRQADPVQRTGRLLMPCTRIGRGARRGSTQHLADRP
jgi:hypothetical protein